MQEVLERIRVSDTAKPIKEITELPASDKLFAASAIIATEPERNPASPFIIHKNILHKMPRTDATFP